MRFHEGLWAVGLGFWVVGTGYWVLELSTQDPEPIASNQEPTAHRCCAPSHGDPKNQSCQRVNAEQ